jgi:putative hydrolase of the HAD superfamily
VSERETRDGMIKAVTVDCWGTLLLDGPLSDERYTPQRLAGIEAVLRASGIMVSRQDLSRAYVASGRRLARIWAEHRDVPVSGYVTMLLEAVDPELPGRLDPAMLDEMVRAYAGPALVAPPAVDPDAAIALGRLAASGVALGVVSNTMRTPGVVLRQILDRAQLLGLFKVVVFSDECGVRKPDPEIFRLALRQVGACPEESCHVGDDAVLDVEGARRAGMGVIQVTHDGHANGPVKPDVVIRALGELPPAVERLRRGAAQTMNPGAQGANA